MNIAIGKLGRSINFDESKASAIGGDIDPPPLFKMLAELNPNINFYMVGKSDLTRFKEANKITTLDDLFGSSSFSFPSNIIDVWENFNSKKHDSLTWPIKFFEENKIKIDFGLIMSGPVSNINIPNKYPTKTDPTKIRKIIEMQKNYVAPIVNWLNHSNIKYVTLSPDPRYHTLGLDFINQPLFDIGQYNDVIINKHFKSESNPDYEDLITHKYKTFYSGLETTFLIGREKINSFEKIEKFNVVLNEGVNRGPELKKYVLDHISDVSIYGKWDEKWYSDSRFKGPVKFKDLYEKMLKTKYTFIIPIKKGYVTSKFWEMIYLGIIPFMHPEYDEQFNIKCPDFIRVKSPEELHDKIEILENDPILYKKCFEDLSSMLKPELFSGEILNSKIMKVINKYAN